MKLWTLLLVMALAGCADSSMSLVNNDRNEQDSSVDTDPFGDSDGDGVVNQDDNCPTSYNPQQADTDNDAIGDACDNCELTANFGQEDSDGNGLGDACDNGDAPDSDGDGIPDAVDNCPDTPNSNQQDIELDGVGDACDNCPDALNANQADHDNDGVGNACDPDYGGEVCASQTFTPDVNQTEPRIVLLLDASGSMADELDPNRPRPWPIDQAADAISQVAGSLEGKARIALSQFPAQTQPGSTCTTRDHVSLGANSAQEITNAVNSITAVGNTPTGFALNSVLDNDLLSDSTDPLNDRRPAAVVLITDGDPTVACDSGTPDNRRVVAQPEAVSAAARLRNAGIPVHVVGFRSGAQPENLNEIAIAGGTDAPGADAFYTANDTAQLVAAIESITVRTVSCSYTLDAVPPNLDQVRVYVNGTEIPESANDGFSFDEFSQIVTLNGPACAQIQDAPDPTQFQITVELTCVEEDTCQPQPEVCDGVDNNCNGQKDEVGCDECGNEICDGMDNDCDDVVDEGCPACSRAGDTCQLDADCCVGSCLDGVCGQVCRPAESPCVNNSDCCGGTCSGSTSSPGVCLAN